MIPARAVKVGGVSLARRGHWLARLTLGRADGGVAGYFGSVKVFNAPMPQTHTHHTPHRYIST